MATTAGSATVVECVTGHIPDVVIGATDAGDGDEVPFAMGEVATLASRSYYAYDDRYASLETQ